MFRCKRLIALFALASSSAAWAGPHEEEVYAAFEAFCLTHINRPHEIPRLFEKVGVKPLPAEKAEAFLMPQKGTAWFVKGKESKFVVVLTDQGVCTTSAPYASGKAVIQLVERLLRHKKVASEDIGSQLQTFYAVTFPNSAKSGGPNLHAAVMLTTSKLESIDGVMMNAMPEAALRENGIMVPNWP